MSLDLVRERLRELEFNFVGKATNAADAIEKMDAPTPAAYVMTARETPQPQRYAAGGYGQRINMRVSVLYVLSASRANDDALADEAERYKNEIRDKLTAWRPVPEWKAFTYAGWNFIQFAEALLWAEALFDTSYDYRGPPA